MYLYLCANSISRLWHKEIIISWCICKPYKMMYFARPPFSENFYLAQVKPFSQRPCLSWASSNLFLSQSVSTSFNVFLTCSCKLVLQKYMQITLVLIHNPNFRFLIYQSQHVFYDSGGGGTNFHSILWCLTALTDAHISVPFHKQCTWLTYNHKHGTVCLHYNEMWQRTQMFNTASLKVCHWACYWASSSHLWSQQYSFLRYIFTFLAILHIPGILTMQVAQTITLANCHTCSLLQMKMMSLSGLGVPSLRKMYRLVRPPCCLWSHILSFQPLNWVF